MAVAKTIPVTQGQFSVSANAGTLQPGCVYIIDRQSARLALTAHKSVGLRDEVNWADIQDKPDFDQPVHWDDIQGKPSLGTAAALDVGASGDALPLLSGHNTWGGVNMFPAGVETHLTGTTVLLSGTDLQTVSTIETPTRETLNSYLVAPIPASVPAGIYALRIGWGAFVNTKGQRVLWPGGVGGLINQSGALIYAGQDAPFFRVPVAGTIHHLARRSNPTEPDPVNVWIGPTAVAHGGGVRPGIAMACSYGSGSWTNVSVSLTRLA